MHSRREWPQLGSSLLFYWMSWTNMNITTLDRYWELPGQSNTQCALPVTARERGCKHWRLPSRHNERGGTDSTKNWEKTSSHWGQYLTIDALNNTDEGLAHRRGRGVCIHRERFPFMSTLAWAQYLNMNNSVFPVRKLGKTLHLTARCCWFQGRYKS
jgi:hypothetical protein